MSLELQQNLAVAVADLVSAMRLETPHCSVNVWLCASFRSDLMVSSVRHSGRHQRPEGAPMDFSAKLENLQAKVNETVETARAAANENREQLKQRVDQAQDDANQAMEDAKQQAEETADRAKSKWAQMKADAAARREDMKAKINKRADQLDAKAAATDADWAEDDAADAIDYAVWMVYDAQLAVLDALDARAYADERAKIAGT
jgi:flagellar biosynthesis GTPase FlhF